jgi:hypothetical protein
MIAERDIEAAVYRAVDTTNELLADPQRLAKSHSTLLLDTGTSLDSMALLNLLVFVEDEIKDAFGLEIVLAGEDGADIDTDALKNLGTLIAKVRTVVNGAH